MLAAFLAGAAFGGALAASGIHQPGAIVSQMDLTNWHMVETFLTASGASTLLVTLLHRLGYIDLKPRSYSSVNVFGPLDGNAIGGCLLGAGMSLSDACPGTLFAQVGAGIRSGAHTLGGAALGGVIWSGFLRPSIDARRKDSKPRQDVLTVHEQLGVSRVGSVAAVEAVFAAAVGVTSLMSLSKTRGLVGTMYGGVLIAAAQLVSVALRRTLLGTSAAFEEVGDWVWWMAGGGGGSRPGSCSSMIMAVGLVAGAWGVSVASPVTGDMPADKSVGLARSATGGVLLTVGSRVAGGCPSGHGISGISLLSVSSFVTVAAMFVGGIGMAAIVR